MLECESLELHRGEAMKRWRQLAMVTAGLGAALIGMPSCKTPAKRLTPPDATPSPSTGTPAPTPAPKESGREAEPTRETVSIPDGPGYQVAATTAVAYWSASERASAIDAGLAVFRKHQCTRCHTIDGQAGHGKPLDCVTCHVFMKGLADDQRSYDSLAVKHGKANIDRYIQRIEHYLVIPNLSQIARRLRPEWIGEFLRAPHDLRPLLEESMIRNQLTRSEIDDLIRYFAAIGDVPDPRARTYQPAPLPPRPLSAWIEKGKLLFAEKTCNTCHTFGNADFGYDAAYLRQMRETTQLAPNLRFARERVQPDKIVDWIVNPQSLVPAATMTKLDITREEASQIAMFIFYGDPQILPMPANLPQKLAKLPETPESPVSWAEAKEQVLVHVCVNCHMNDHEEDPGPGNRGGFGYSGVELGFRTYERAMWGAVDKTTGRRYSVFQRRPGERLPRILQVLLARRVENLRDHLAPFADHELPGWGGSPRLGMPLGLPALSDERIANLAKWIEGDCPGPETTTGKPGFTDGYLVPDAPIDKNSGCELRPPAGNSPTR